MGLPTSVTRFTNTFSHPLNSEQDYLIGLRGVLVIQSFLWAFLQTFAPTTVYGSNNSDGPNAQVIIRKIFSVLFWNETLIYSSIIFLSARTICIPFLLDPSKANIASSIFRRSIRLAIPTFVALAIIAAIFNSTGLSYINDFKSQTGNTSFSTPSLLSNTLIYFNSAYDLFWTNKSFSTQSGVTAFPTQTSYIISIIFQQSYTVYMVMVIVPYTRNSWRLKALVTMCLAAWWVQSWTWYSVSGLLMADTVINMGFREKSRAGLALPHVWKLRSRRLPSWSIYAVLMAAGLIMQYLWVSWRPSMVNYELKGHTTLYTGGGLNTDPDLTQPQARDDNFLLILGFMLLIETYELPRRLLTNPAFVYLGKRSFSFYLTQGWILYSVGIKLWMHMISQGASTDSANIAALVVCLVITGIVGEVWYRLIDYPSFWVSRWLYGWIVKE